MVASTLDGEPRLKPLSETFQSSLGSRTALSLKTNLTSLVVTSDSVETDFIMK